MFACVSMNMSDRLRLIQFPAEVIDLTRTAIKSAWPKGIQEERNYYGAHEFKLRGNPWRGQSGDAIPSRSLMCTVLATLYNLGWVVLHSTDISKKQLDKDSILFRHQMGPVIPCTWLSISFNRGDLLRLIHAPPEMIPAFRSMFGPLLQSEGWKVSGVAYEFKCRGYPWFAAGSEAVSTRVLLLSMLSVLESQGFKLYASLDQNTGPGGESNISETDSWYCCRPMGWTPGMQVYYDPSQ